jgi:hypothetical protein
MSENTSTITTMYSADFICTYKMMDNDDDRNIMYQIQLLQAFDMHEFHEGKINEKTLQLYQTLINCKEVKEILEEGIKVNSEMQLTDEIMFMCLFSYQFFDLFHKCLIDYFTIGSILEESKRNMIYAIISQ